MGISKKPPKGTRDLFPPLKRKMDYIFSVMKKTAEQFSFEPYDGPIVEEVELYKAKSGEELINDQIYSFTDRGGREIAIRPEMTPTVARMVAGVHKEIAKPIRWYSIPNLMRYERPQKGRLREHWQYNVDIFGAPELLGEIEVLQVAVKLLTNFGATSEMFQIYLNDRKFVDAVFKGLLKLSDEECYKLYKVVDKAKKVTAEALDEMVSKILQGEKKEIFLSYLKLNSFGAVVKFSHEHQIEIDSLIKFSEKLKALELDQYITYDPMIVRGLDYYTGIVFEIFDINPENKRAISGGGSYANLLQIFNESPLTGVGFGLGDVTLADFLETHKLMPNFDLPQNDILISYQDESCEDASFKVASALRNKDLKVEVYMGKAKPKKLFTFAQNKGHKFLSFMGTNELDAEEVQIKNLETKESKQFKLSEIEEITNFIKG